MKAKTQDEKDKKRWSYQLLDIIKEQFGIEVFFTKESKGMIINIRIDENSWSSATRVQTWDSCAVAVFMFWKGLEKAKDPIVTQSNKGS